MQRRSTLLVALSALFLVAACAQPVMVSNAKHHKLLIQMSDADPAKWSMALNNAKNVQDELGAANVDIELVAFGPGIQLLKFDSLACENTLRNLKISKSDIIAGASYVPAGVVQIMRR